MARGLTKEQVLRAAVELADESGIEALSMRRLGRALGVEAMSLYHHVGGKDDLLHGMVDLVWSEIELPGTAGGWRAAVRGAAVSAHRILVRHPWACGLAMSSARAHPARLRYMDAILGAFTAGGFPPHLVYHGYHAVDSHVIGFTMWELGHTAPPGDLDELAASFLRDLAGGYPHLAQHVRHHLDGLGRDGEDGFGFVLGLILDGLDRARPA